MKRLAQREGDPERIEIELGRVAAGGGGGTEGDRQTETETDRDRETETLFLNGEDISQRLTHVCAVATVQLLIRTSTVK